jgi:hypothetical protein
MRTFQRLNLNVALVALLYGHGAIRTSCHLTTNHDSEIEAD